MSEQALATSNQQPKKPVYKQWWFWVIIVVVIIGIGGAGASSDKEPKKVDSDNDSSVASSEDKEDKNEEFKIGDTVAIDDREMTVKEVRRGYTSKYLTPGEGNEYVLVRVEFQNKSDEKVSWYSNEWKIEDSNGAIEGTATMVNDEDDRLDYGELAPNGKKAGTLVYEVPKGDTNLRLHYQPSMFGKREAIISLQ